MEKNTSDFENKKNYKYYKQTKNGSRKNGGQYSSKSGSGKASRGQNPSSGKKNYKSQQGKKTQGQQTYQKKSGRSYQSAGKTYSVKNNSALDKAASERISGAQKQSKTKKSQSAPVRISFIGGLNEIGKNVTMYEYGDEAVLVDCGMAFPDDTMLGIDIVIPDFTHVVNNKDKIKGILLTHGHEDHIGAIPYLLNQISCPIYGTQLTLGLVEAKLKEHNMLSSARLVPITPSDVTKLGKNFTVEFINVNHSIPGAVALAINTPAGTIVQTGDFKMDMTPISGDIIDIGRLAAIGNEGVLCLLSDSTNAERPGYTASERTVGDAFNTLFASGAATDRRIIIATFASNVHRVQQIIDCAHRFGRKVAVSGRSMINTVAIGQELGYLNVPEGVLVDISCINKYPKNQMVLITTGSQGEPMSALTRMAFEDHRLVSVGSDDFIIISATPIPGNEKTVANVVNELLKHGCEVVYEKMYDVHVSGHACQEELKMMLGITKPQYFIPVHGEQKHLKKHAGLASAMGMTDDRILIADLGDCVEVSENGLKVVEKVPSGRVLVDGLGVGDVGGVVLRDRKHLGQDGLIIACIAIDVVTGAIVSGPDVISRGFVYVRDSEPLMAEARQVLNDALDQCMERNIRDWGAIKNRMRDELSRMIFERTRRSPMILPVIMEV